MSLDTQTVAAPAAVAPLSMDQAVERAIERKAKAAKATPAAAVEEEPAAAAVESPEGAGEVETPDSEAATQAADDGEEAPETDTLDAEQEQAADPAKGTLEAPARWEAEDKAVFATLPAKAQETILRREKLQQAEVTKAQQKSAEVSKTFETRIQHLEAVSERIGEYVDSGQAGLKAWESHFVAWDNWFASQEAIDLSASDNAAYRAQEARFRKEQATYAQEKRAYEKAVADKVAADGAAFAAYAQEQARLIPELIPELADEKEGAKRKSDLFTYLRAEGFEPERIKGISAKEAQIGWKAKKYDALGDVDALVRDAELYRKADKLTKAPPIKPKVQAGPSAPAAGQGQRPSSDEAEFRKLSALPKLNLDQAARKAELRKKLGK
jgi:hypothetical protein